MIPRVIAFESQEELEVFLVCLAGVCPTEDPEKETTDAKQPLTGGSVDYYTVKVKGQSVECNDVSDALQLTPNEFNIFKEIWRTANARLGNGKPGNTALRGAEKIAYYANRILEAEKQKA